MSMYKNLDEVVLALDNINLEIRGDVTCDSQECAVACSASHCEAMFKLYYDKFKGKDGKQRLGQSFRELFKITNFLSSQIHELMENEKFRILDETRQAAEEVVEPVVLDRNETKQIAEEAARSVVADALATFQKDLTENMNRKMTELVTAVQEQESKRLPTVQDEPYDSAPGSADIESLVPKTRYSVLIELPDNDDGKSQPISKEGYKSVERQLQKQLEDVPVDRRSLSDKGRVTMILPDKESKDKALKKLTGFKTTDTTKPEKKILPKIKLVDVDEAIWSDQPETGEISQKDRDDKRELSKKKFIDAVKTKNPFLEEMFKKGETFEVVFMNKRESMVVVKVSPVFREFLRKHGDKLHVGFRHLDVRDHFNPTQCYHCQGFGHRVGSPKCPSRNESPVCMYCAKTGHRSRKCYSKDDLSKRCCVNCLNSQDPHLRKYAREHCSSSDTCPLMIRETKTLMNRTLATAESKNEYLRKLMMTKEQQRCLQRF